MAAKSFSVWTARPAFEALIVRGLDPEAPLRASGISRQALNEVENRLPGDAVERFWEEAAKAAHDASFGVHVAETLPKGSLDLIDYLAAVSPTVGAALARLSQYIRLYYDASDVHLVIEPKHGRLLSRAIDVARQYDEFTVALLLARSRLSSGQHWLPERVMFQHSPPDDEGELKRVFGCPLQFSASHIEMCFSAHVLQLPHVQADSRLLGILLRYADQQLAQLPARGNLVARASSSITKELVHGLPTLSSTAQALHMRPRTLQRQLAAQGLTYTALLDEVRRGLALRYIGDAGLGISELAYLLHFSDATALNRAFKKWTGETPTHYRQQLLRETH